MGTFFHKICCDVSRKEVDGFDKVGFSCREIGGEKLMVFRTFLWLVLGAGADETFSLRKEGSGR